MQTFLPLSNFEQSAQVLDISRCGKQRLETLELLAILSGKKPDYMSEKWWERCIGHKNHPAVHMWRGSETSLVSYGESICREWKKRGYKDNLLPKISAFYAAFGSKIVYPNWLGDTKFHAAHRSNLLRKKPEWYQRYGWTEKADLPYIWPT